MIPSCKINDLGFFPKKALDDDADADADDNDDGGDADPALAAGHQASGLIRLQRLGDTGWSCESGSFDSSLCVRETWKVLEY